MAVNVKMGVDIGGFTAGIKEGQQILKGLNAELKASEAEFKATGNAEQKMTSQTKTLTSQMNVQKSIADQARQALQRMTDAGINPADSAYQKMYITMMNAEAGMNEAQASLNALGQGAGNAAAQAEQLTGSLNGISKKISLDQVQSGIQKITTGLENAAKKAVELGEKLWSTIMDSAARADDTATMAQMYGIDIDTFERMQKLVAGGMDTSVEAILKAQDKMTKGVGKGTKEVMSVLDELGIRMREGVLEDWTSWQQKDPQKLFWEAGQAIMAMGDAYDKEAAAQALFGKSWKELVPLFETYKTLDEYNAALEEQTVTSEETVRDLAALNDAVGALESSWTTLKDELIGAIAPALTEAATAAGGLLDKLTEYLQTDEGQAMLSQLGDAVSELLSGITKLSADDVVNGFKDALSTLTSSLTWISENKDGLVTALEAIAVAFAGLKLADIAINIGKIVSGFQTLWGGANNPLPTMPGAEQAGGEAAAGTAAKGGFFATLKNFVTTGGGIDMLAPLAVLGLGLGIGQWGNNIANAETAEKAEQLREKVSKLSEADAAFLESAAAALDVGGGQDTKESLLMGLADRSDLEKAMLVNVLRGFGGEDWASTWNDLQNFWNGGEMDQFQVTGLLEAISQAYAKMAEQNEKPEIPVEPEVPEDAATQIAEQVGTVTVPVKFNLAGSLASFFGIPGHANGLPWVPYDGYLALLHRGERIMTASQNRSYTYNNNNYFGNVNLNNGQDIDALCDRIDRRNRRMQTGYGS